MFRKAMLHVRSRFGKIMPTAVIALSFVMLMGAAAQVNAHGPGMHGATHHHPAPATSHVHPHHAGDHMPAAWYPNYPTARHFRVFYRANPAAPWVACGSCPQYGAAAELANSLRAQGFDVFVR